MPQTDSQTLNFLALYRTQSGIEFTAENNKGCKQKNKMKQNLSFEIFMEFKKSVAALKVAVNFWVILKIRSGVGF